MGTIGSPETSVTTTTLRNIPEKQKQHLTLFPNLGMHREEYFNQI